MLSRLRHRLLCYFFVTVTSLVLCATCVAQLSFVTTRYGVTGQGLQVTTGDFNHDGLPDMAAGDSSGSVDVFLATTAGHYGTFTPYAVGAAPGAIAAGDFTGDRLMDLAVAVPSQNRIAIFINNGDGTFRPGPDLTTGAPATSIALGDFNQDGKVDLADVECVSNATGCSLNVYLSNGDGSFRNGGALNSTDHHQGNVVAIDFNRDGHMDLAVPQMGPTSVLVYFGHGDGTFSAPSSVAVSNPIPANTVESVPALATGDFNNNAIPDLAVLAGNECGEACGTQTVHIFFSNGSGGFTAGPAFQAAGGSSGGELAASDLNGDMNQDLIFFDGAHFGAGTIYFLGHGNGSFTSTSSNFMPSEFSDLVARDLNLDSRHDVAIGSWSDDSMVVGLNSSGATNCGATGGTPGSIVSRICQPSNGQTVLAGSAFTVKAGGNSPAGVARMELWVDGVKRFQIWNDQLRQSITLGAGSHKLAVVAADRYVGFATTTITVNASSSGCATPATARTIHICSPVNNSTVTSPVHIDATARPGSSAISVMQVYVDGVKKFQQSAGSLIHHSDGGLELVTNLAMSAATHRITVQALDSAGAFKATVFATVH